MMPSNLDSEIDKCDGQEETTRQLLGSLITRPKLTDKLLQKPPFRFLYDIIMEVNKVTGFASNLFTDLEMDAANITEKQQKLKFLEKIIKVVGIQLNTIVAAKPNHIIAGQV
jgi:TRAF3-interacting protein 1